MTQDRPDYVETDSNQRFNPERYNAFAQLLSRPDPAGMPRRANVNRWPGEPNRRGTRLPGILMAWMQRRHLALDVDEWTPIVTN
jgi:hypothetical protein